MSLTKKLRWTLRSIPATIVLAFVCIILMGGGHGTFVPAMLVFPYAMLVRHFVGTIDLTVIVLALAQFVVYGMIADLAVNFGLRYLVVLLLMIHFVTAAYVFINRAAWD